jgi:hypothetical protein
MCAFLVCSTFEYLFLMSAAFITELEHALEYIRRAPQLSIDEKKRFFKSANTNFGLTALCLSGGASFGYCKLSEKLPLPRLTPL